MAFGHGVVARVRNRFAFRPALVFAFGYSGRCGFPNADYYLVAGRQMGDGCQCFDNNRFAVILKIILRKEKFMETIPQPMESEYPVKLEVPYPENSSRLLALMTLLLFIPKAIIMIPHFIAVYFVGIVAFFAWIIGQFGVLFTGKYPRSMFDFVVGLSRWQARVNAYFMGLTDKYPPFSLK